MRAPTKPHTRRCTAGCAVLLVVVSSLCSTLCLADAPRANLLGKMELTQGSADLSTAGASLAADARRGAPPALVFGVELPNKKPDKAEDQTTNDNEWTEDRQKQDSDELAAQLVRSQQRASDPTGSSQRPLTRQWNALLARNPEARKQYQESFETLDLDSNKKLSDYEINSAVNSGKLSRIGARTLKTWDVNFDRSISWQEFRMGPVFIMVLESNEKLFREFRTNGHNSASKVTEFLRAHVLDSYEAKTPASFSFIQTSAFESRSTTEALDSATMRELGLDQVMQQQQQQQQFDGAYPQATNEQRPEMYEDPEEARFAEAQRQQFNIGGVINKVANVVQKVTGKAGGIVQSVGSTLGLTSANKKTDNARVLAAQKTRYQSKFGVPKYEDERCVLCQYVVQSVEAELKTKVVDDATAFSDWPTPSSEQTGGMNSLDAATGRDPNVRKSSRLLDTRGERSPTRVVTEVTERVMRDVCGDSAPFLYRQPCHQIWRNRRELGHGIVRKLPSGANCQKAQFCATGTYFYNGLAVHYPEMSNKFNGGRGLCGMIGGPNSRTIPGLSEGTCFLKTVGKHAGLDMFRFQHSSQQQQQQDTSQEDPTNPTPTTSIDIEQQQEARVEAASTMLQQQQQRQQMMQEGVTEQQETRLPPSTRSRSQPTPVPPQ